MNDGKGVNIMLSLNEMIYKRKSFRSYTDEPVDEATMQKIKEFTAGIKPLYPDIKVYSEIVSKEDVRCVLPWITPQLIAIFTEDKEGALENVGFIYQQLDLYLQSIGLGACWLGMGMLRRKTAAEMSEDGMKCVMFLTVGYPKEDALRSDISEFRRKPLSEIADKVDNRLEPARLAPSSTNSQPWYFVHEGDVMHAYCALKGFLRAKILGDLNRMDMGIALAHMYVANPDTFRFFKEDNIEEINGYKYIGSFTLG